MDGILQFLIVAGIIVIGIAKQFKKEAKKNAENKPAMPLPDEEMDNDAMPFPESWGKTYGGFIPEGPEEEAEPVFIPNQPRKKYKSTTSKTFLPGEPAARASAYSPVVDPNLEVPPPPSVSQNPSTENEYTIHSADEARKAIIWSEILRRKY